MGKVNERQTPSDCKWSRCLWQGELKNNCLSSGFKNISVVVSVLLNKHFAMKKWH